MTNRDIGTNGVRESADRFRPFILLGTYFRGISSRKGLRKLKLSVPTEKLSVPIYRHPSLGSVSLRSGGEERRAVAGYEGLYEVSNLGRVRSLHVRRHRNEGGLLTIKQASPNWDYQVAVLCRNGKPKSFRVHALVAEAFIGPRPDGVVIDHIDGNRNNNASTNLRYCTQLTNLRSGRGTRLSEGDVRALRALHRTGNYTYTALGRMFKISPVHARQIVSGRRWPADDVPVRVAVAEAAT